MRNIDSTAAALRHAPNKAAPAQATSYFYGYLNLLALRQEVEKALGAKFRPRPFHDFILSQGLLPPKLLRQAVLAEFVPGAR